MFLFPDNYKNITVDDIKMEVKDSDIDVINQTEHYNIYNDSDNGILVVVLEDNGNESEKATFETLKNSNQIDAKLQESSNYSYNYSDTIHHYTYLTDYTNKTILIVTENKEDMEHILSTIDEESVTISINDNEESISTSTTTTSNNAGTEKTSSNEREEDKITSDGWNPKEHEVSREKTEDGNERVTYDDGYSRLVDKQGNILSYGY